MVVGVPCSLIFWHFWLFIDFRLVVILLLVVQGSEGFLPTPTPWQKLQDDFFLNSQVGQWELKEISDMSPCIHGLVYNKRGFLVLSAKGSLFINDTGIIVY